MFCKELNFQLAVNYNYLINTWKSKKDKLEYFKLYKIFSCGPLDITIYCMVIFSCYCLDGGPPMDFPPPGGPPRGGFRGGRGGPPRGGGPMRGGFRGGRGGGRGGYDR